MTMISKHWGMHDLRTGFANVYSPTITDDRVDSFSTKREIYRGLKELECLLKDAGFKGWVSWTELTNPHIMKFLTKLKSYPYGIDLKRETIWFKKEF